MSIHAYLRKSLERCPPEHQPWKNVMTTTVNAVLRQACEMAQVEPITTHSFRHNFIRRAMSYCSKKNIDVKLFTDHLGDDMLRSHYGE